jgi:hypothetical protein
MLSVLTKITLEDEYGEYFVKGPLGGGPATIAVQFEALVS